MKKKVVNLILLIFFVLLLTGCGKSKYSVIDEGEKKGVAGKASAVITQQILRAAPQSDDQAQTPESGETQESSGDNSTAKEPSEDGGSASQDQSSQELSPEAQAAMMMEVLKQMGMSSEEASEYMSIRTSVGRITAADIFVPDSSSEFSNDLAIQMLAYNCGNGRSDTAGILLNSGFEIVGEAHYDKSADDVSHNCAYLIAKKEMTYRGSKRNVLLTVIRGTSKGEWYSNFDVVPSRTDEPKCAENFLEAANDVFMGLEKVVSETEDPVFFVTGHSRGAAAANLLGVLLDAKYGTEDTYVYTFASPTTVTGSFPEGDHSNIFNLINQSDLVPLLPLEGWGFSRVGTDIGFISDEASQESANSVAKELLKVAPDVNAYYTDRHSLTKSGLSEDGLTAYEFMNLFAKYLAGESFTGASQSDSDGLGIAELSSVISLESDLAPIVAMMNKLMMGESKVLMNHLPTTYLQTLIRLSSGGR